MMHQMIQKHLPVGQKPLSGKNRLPLKTQFPVLGPSRIAGCLQRSASLGRALIKKLQQPILLKRRPRPASGPR